MTVEAGPDIVNDGLILNLDAANSKSYPGSDTTWSDLSGNANTGTLVNGPTYGSANNGSIVFNGTNSYATVADNANLRFNSSQSFTLSAWIKPAVLQNNWTGIVTKSRDSSNWYGIWIDPSNRITWGAPVFNIFGPTATTQWQNIVISKDGSVRYIYVNGVLTNTEGRTLDVSGTTPMNIGRGGTVGEYFNGNIQDVKLYNILLSASQILQNFNALRGRYGI
jgi:hypothetical protein